ncbi:FliA/WhiG family RNA polymerase sigma factor [Alkalihalobacillus sp. FSL R5-0424]
MINVGLSKEEKMWEDWFNDRSREACDHLVRMYLPLVQFHVQRISIGLPGSVRKDELTSHGLYGLLDALEKFDPNRDLKFDTYASFRVRGAIIDGLRKEDWLSRSMREKIKRVEAASEKLEQQEGRYVSSAEVAEFLHMDESDVAQIMAEQFVANILSIDEPTQEAERQESFAATIEDKLTKTPEATLMESATKDELAEVIAGLTEKEQLVISLFYYEELTLTEIGHILELSTSRISQIHSKALFKLRQVMEKQSRSYS